MLRWTNFENTLINSPKVRRAAQLLNERLGPKWNTDVVLAKLLRLKSGSQEEFLINVTPAQISYFIEESEVDSEIIAQVFAEPLIGFFTEVTPSDEPHGYPDAYPDGFPLYRVHGNEEQINRIIQLRNSSRLGGEKRREDLLKKKVDKNQTLDAKPNGSPNGNPDESLKETSIQSNPIKVYIESSPTESHAETRPVIRDATATNQLHRFYADKLKTSFGLQASNNAKVPIAELIEAYGLEKSKALVVAFLNDPNPWLRDEGFPIRKLVQTATKYLNGSAPTNRKRPLTFVIPSSTDEPSGASHA